jgi:hypothetical protein
VRANYNRQTRRANLCIRACNPREDRLAITPNGVRLTTRGHDLAETAASIADDIELSTEMIELLLWPGSPSKDIAGRVP